MSVAGRVATGFSKPYVAKYAVSGNEVIYSDARILARGVSVALNPESSDDNNFYADNQLAESAAGVFTGGTADLTVDGLFTESERFIFGLPVAGSDGWTGVGDSSNIPDVALGFIVRYQSEGVVTFVPIILAKTKFNLPQNEFATQEDEIDWQTTSLTTTLMRDDSPNHNWKLIGADFPNEAAAEAALQAKLNYSAPAGEALLNALTIGLNALAPAFNPYVTAYEVETENASDVVTAALKAGDTAAITLNGDPFTNGTAATWDSGENTLEIVVTSGTATKTYTVIVTAS